jgi:hypothetical protein
MSDAEVIQLALRLAGAGIEDVDRRATRGEPVAA